MVKVAVKWNKRVFEDVELAPDVVQFKAKLQELTGVPATRQKLMAKGAWRGILKDDMDLASCSIKEGQQVTLMGSAEVLAAPKEEVRFIEDMKTEDLAQSGAVLPAGFVNLGNTCYMNSTLQCIRKVPELREALGSFVPTSNGSEGNLSSVFTASLNETFNTADRSTDAFQPTVFVQVLRQLYPQFAQQGPRGGFMQQDAEELYSAVVNTLALCLKEPPALKIKEGDEVRYRKPPSTEGGDGAEGDGAGEGKGDSSGGPGEGTEEERAIVVKVHPDAEEVHYTIRTLGEGGKEKNTEASRISKVYGLSDLGEAENVIDALFGLEMEEEFNCEETGESKVSASKAKKLVCNIQGGAGSNSQAVFSLMAGSGSFRKHTWFYSESGDVDCVPPVPLCLLREANSPDAELVMEIAGRILPLRGADEVHVGNLTLSEWLKESTPMVMVQINHLADGMKLGLTDKVEKHSDKLGRDATFTMQSRIKRLPRYLCVQVLRFFWKATPDSMDHMGVKCKIMRRVSFPLTLDLYEFCAPSLQAILKVPRHKEEQLIFERESKEKAEREAKAAAERAEKEKKRGKVFGHLTAGKKATSAASAPAASAPAASAPAASAPAAGVEESKTSAASSEAAVTEAAVTEATVTEAAVTEATVTEAAVPEATVTEAAKVGEEAMDVDAIVEGEADNEEEGADLRAALAMSMEVEDAGVEGAAGPGLPGDFKGNYELFAVVTHKGREADGGHYMAWVRQEGDDWLEFDDADVSPRKTEDIMKLGGGGDWHMAYLTFYRFKD